MEKPDLDGRRLANAGAYVFPRTVFATELTVSSRGEYEITDYVSGLTARQTVQVVRAEFWLPIGTEEAWNNAQQQDLDRHLTAER